MTTFHYFAFGSNMLTVRLQNRCRSASFVTVARAQNYRLQFCKRSNDGSGKATLVPDDSGSEVFDVVFEISTNEQKDLDDFEGSAYDRCDFPVSSIRTGEAIAACTYLAREHHGNLRPYDWYLGLVLGGIAEHGIDEVYAAALRAIPCDVDPKADRPQRVQALEAFERAGITDYTDCLLCLRTVWSGVRISPGAHLNQRFIPGT